MIIGYWNSKQVIKANKNVVELFVLDNGMIIGLVVLIFIAIIVIGYLNTLTASNPDFKLLVMSVKSIHSTQMQTCRPLSFTLHVLVKKLAGFLVSKSVPVIHALTLWIGDSSKDSMPNTILYVDRYCRMTTLQCRLSPRYQTLVLGVGDCCDWRSHRQYSIIPFSTSTSYPKGYRCLCTSWSNSHCTMYCISVFLSATFASFTNPLSLFRYYVLVDTKLVT